MIALLSLTVMVQARIMSHSDDGRAMAEKLSNDATPQVGLHMDERTLAQLYGGYLSPRHLASTGHLKVTREADLQGMQAILYPWGQPAPNMADGF